MRRPFVVLVALVACRSEHGAPPPDRDADGYRVPDDCDDDSPYVNPAAVELCDGVDDDCDGIVDVNAIDKSTFYVDADADGFGTGGPTVACDVPAGTAPVGGDCDDTNGAVHVGAPEVCGDGIDNDCDGVAPMCDWTGDIEASEASATISMYDDGALVGHEVCAWSRDAANRTTAGSIFRMASIHSVDGNRPLGLAV